MYGVAYTNLLSRKGKRKKTTQVNAQTPLFIEKKKLKRPRFT